MVQDYTIINHSFIHEDLRPTPMPALLLPQVFSIQFILWHVVYNSLTYTYTYSWNSKDRLKKKMIFKVISTSISQVKIWKHPI